MNALEKGFFSIRNARMLGHKRYEPIWLMMHKIRRVMGKRDEKYKLDGCIEFDQGFFKRVDNKDVIEDKDKNNKDDPKPGKRGRGSERQAKVLVMVESQPGISAPKRGNQTEKQAT